MCAHAECVGIAGSKFQGKIDFPHGSRGVANLPVQGGEQNVRQWLFRAFADESGQLAYRFANRTALRKPQYGIQSERP